ncbi:MAG: cell division protease FtsH [Solirubrobacteraceae bacterium]|nr:cell division protease FtsH [Solirubrobacteraceae bacterium]
MPDDAGRQPADAPRQRPAPAPGGNRRAGGQGEGEPRTPWRVDPAPDGRGKQPERRPPTGMSWRRFGILLLITFVVSNLIVAVLPGGEAPARISYTPFFLQQVQAGNVKVISARGESVSGQFKKAVDPPGKAGKTTEFTTEIPTFANATQLSNLLQQKGVEVNADPPNQGRSLLGQLLISLLPFVLIIGLFVFLARRAASGAGGLGQQFGRTRAKRVETGSTRTTFEDVAGIDEAEDELVEIVDFLRRPEKYQALGAKIPRGVLLSGAPGTGKTLLARAMAGEAEVPFFSASAAEFIEMIVGVGASRVRDLFEEAKKAAPAIIFIDELDAIGRARGGNQGLGGHDEREQTLNQVLTEMDGFDPSIGVIVLAATNRPEVLDPALLRPGRFDRRVVVQSPDQVGRRKILEVHTRSVPVDPSVDLGAIASSTPGMVGADLANLVNEAALLAARRGHPTVVNEDFTDALEKVILGAERKVVMSDDERQRTAYHEAGHALVGMLTPGADPVRKISIIPRGQALGVTLSAPEADRFNYDEAYLRSKILVALGGRVAEEVVYGTITTGAESDIQQLTQITRGMVTRGGMSEAIGPIAVDGAEAQNQLLPGASSTSESTQQLIDAEVRRIVDEAHHDVSLLLGQHREQLEALTRALLARETLDEADAYKAAGVDRHPAPQTA